MEKKAKLIDDFREDMGVSTDKKEPDNRSTLPLDSKKIQIFHGLKYKKIKHSRNWMLPASGKSAMLEAEEALHEYQQDINEFM